MFVKRPGSRSVLANAQTGLLADDIFYFGNAIGETGDRPLDAIVDDYDVLDTRNNPHPFFDPAPIDCDYDFNRDERVDAIDTLICQNNQTTAQTALHLIAAPAIVGRHVFYNDSYFDGEDPAVNAADDDAVAPDKTALLPGQTASFANLTSYYKGIYGIMIDFYDLEVTPTAADFQFRVGNDFDPNGWDTLATTPSITLREDAGDGGSDRVTILWPEDTILAQWVQVTVLPTASTGLPAADVFYFGNLPGDTNGTDGPDADGYTEVDLSDVMAILASGDYPSSGHPIDYPFDFNRDTELDIADITIMQDYFGKVPGLALLTAPQPDIVMTGFATSSDQFDVSYRIDGANASPFHIGIYRSTDGIHPEAELMSYEVTDPSDLTGSGTTHNVTFPADFIDVEEDHYLIAVADVYADVSESDELNNQYLFEGGIFQDSNGVVCVFGSNDPDTVSISVDTLDDEYDVSLGTSTVSYDTGAVSKFHIRTYHGDDVVDAFDSNNLAPMLAWAGSGADGVETGSADDTIYCGPGDDVVETGEGDNTVYGEDGDDSVDAGGGDDVLYGGTGDDTLQGGPGNDILHGDEGVDEIYGQDGDDVLYGGDGTDILRGDNDSDIIDGGADDDDIEGGAGDDTIDGQSGADTIRGGSGDDILSGGDGVYADFIYGDSGNDWIDGEDGDDYLDGMAESDIIYGGEGADEIYGGGGDDVLYGGNGSDTMDGGADDDWIDGGGAADTILGDAGQDILYGGDGDDIIEGGAGHDDLYGDGGSDQLFGDDGNDILDGGADIDEIDGGPDLDNPEILDDGDGGYSELGNSWEGGSADAAFEDDYRYFDWDGKVTSGSAVASWEFSNGQAGIRAQAYATWVNVTSPANNTYTVYDADDPVVTAVDQSAELPDVPLHDHDWKQLGADHTFDVNTIEVKLATSMLLYRQYACADAAMLTPIWPELDLATDSNNDGTIDPTPGGADDRIERASPGRIVAAGDPQRAEVEIDLDAKEYDLSDKTLRLDFTGEGTLVNVYDAATDGNLITSGTAWTIGQELSSVYVEGLSAGSSTLTLTLVGFPTARPVPDQVRVSVVDVDLDTDSDNDGVVEPKDATEDAIEDDPEEPGKVIRLNKDDDNQNDTPDLNDLHRWDYTSKNATDDDFAEMKLAFSGVSLGDLEGYELWLGSQSGLKLYSSTDKQWLIQDPGDGSDTGQRSYSLPTNEGMWYKWTLDAKVKLPKTVYAEGVSTGTHHAYWRLVKSSTQGILGRDTVQVTSIYGDLTAYRPLHESGGYAPFAKTDVEEVHEEDDKLGPGIRINNDDDVEADGEPNGIKDRLEPGPIAGENDLIEVLLSRDPTDRDFRLRRNSGQIKVWTSQTKGTAIPFPNENSLETDNLPFASGAEELTVWVEWGTLNYGTADLQIKDTEYNIVMDTIKFHTFKSVVIVFGGQGQIPIPPTPGNPLDPNLGVFHIGTALYEEGYDVHMYDEEKVDDFDYLPYYEVENAVKNRRATHVSSFGYSHGGGATEVLSRQLADDLNVPYTLDFTGYIDAVDHDGIAQENERPKNSVYHANYYQHGVWAEDRGLDGGPIKDPPGADFEIDVEKEPKGSPWDPKATHYNIDDLEKVQKDLRKRFEDKDEGNVPR